MRAGEPDGDAAADDAAADEAPEDPAPESEALGDAGDASAQGETAELPPSLGGAGAKIAMTAPVTTAPIAPAPESGGAYMVRFVMPAEWTEETLPAPENEAVSFHRIPARFVAAAGFTGPRGQAAVDAAQAEVAALIEAYDLNPIGAYAVAGFDGPDVPEAQRRWEVQRPVADPDPAILPAPPVTEAIPDADAPAE